MLGADDLADDGSAAEPPTPAPRKKFRAVEPTAAPEDWLVPALFLLLAAGLIVLGLQMQSRLTGDSSNAKIELWGRLAMHAAAFFAIVGPLAFGGVAVAARAMKFVMPASAYVRTCAVVAVPALAYVGLQLLTIHRMAGGLTVFFLVVAAGLLTYLAGRVLIGTSWAAAVGTFFGVAVFGGVGFLIAALVVDTAAAALFAALAR
jgi:hypothetical protein